MKESYTAAFKEQALSKVYQRGNRTIATIAKELNMNVGTLKNWMKNMSQNDRAQFSGRDKRPQDWSLDERMSALLSTHALSGETLQAWCREHGVFSHQLTQWRTEFCRPTTNGDGQLMRTLKDENKRLERELTRKEKALAEAAALLVLQKKFQALLGGEAV